MEYEDKFSEKFSEFEDMEDDFPKIEKITKKKKFRDEEPFDWKKTRKTKRWQWYGNRDTIRHMNNEF